MSMNLAQKISSELSVDPQSILLLRHGNAKTSALRKAGATVEEYTLVQPNGTKYDFEKVHKNSPRVLVVVAIVDDKVYAVYRILGIEKEGTTRSLTSEAFNRFDVAAGYPEVPARRYQACLCESDALGRPISGWSNPRSAVARSGSKIFEAVEFH